MANKLIETIINRDDDIRNRSINALLEGSTKDELLRFASELEDFRLSSKNLYHKVRASLFLYVIFRFYLQEYQHVRLAGAIPYAGVKRLYERDFEGALQIFLTEIKNGGDANGAIYSAIADTYRKTGFKYLLDQVKLSISHCPGNILLYGMKGLQDYTYRAPSLYTSPDASGIYPVGFDTAPVRLDPSHSGWSDIFFLGMDYPEGARVVNISVDLRVSGSEYSPMPPCACYCRYIREPLIRLSSVDLRASAVIHTLDELFNFGSDHLSLLKAGVVASGIIPPAYEGTPIRLEDILERLLGKSGGIEVVTKVHNIPKGSRLAVSTTLLCTIITRLMRFSGQIRSQTGSMTEEERRIVASRAILGEWLGGSGGGWQDSGGLWPGIKIITGKTARKGDPEYGISRGCLLPEHHLLSRDDIPQDVESRIAGSIVLVHGGISQNVGPILEMVTEKYILKYKEEWNARLKGVRMFGEILNALKKGDMRELGELTTEDWENAIQRIIPWVNNAFTQELIMKMKEEFREDYWGFLMLGGMSGGGMAFIVDPFRREEFKQRVVEVMHDLQQCHENSFPFIIKPVAYDFSFNHDGIMAGMLHGSKACIPLPEPSSSEHTLSGSSEVINDEVMRERFGLDTESHEYMRALLKSGEIGLRQNRLSPETVVEDASPQEVNLYEDILAQTAYLEAGSKALRRNEVVVVTLAGGMGSRWTEGSTVVKSISPTLYIDGKYRSFLETHIAKSRRTEQDYGHEISCVFTTSYLTYNAIQDYLQRRSYFGHKNSIYLSQSVTVGRRVYPMERDLRFLWNEELRQKEDDNVQKVLDDIQEALIAWTRQKGEGEDFQESSIPLRFNPPGHWYEIPNMIKNGLLARILTDNPGANYLFCHNVDTVGACLDPAILGAHMTGRTAITFEVTPRRIEDEGGGLATVDGRLRLIEGMALPQMEDEWRLSFYNTNTNWVSIDALLDYFQLDRRIIIDAACRPEMQRRVSEALSRVEKLMPTYVTIKHVRHLWGRGQEDVYPVAQFEKLWGDMTSLPDLSAQYIAVPRMRGQQLKHPAQLDIFLRDGSFDYLKKITLF